MVAAARVKPMTFVCLSILSCFLCVTVTTAISHLFSRLTFLSLRAVAVGRGGSPLQGKAAEPAAAVTAGVGAREAEEAPSFGGKRKFPDSEWGDWNEGPLPIGEARARSPVGVEEILLEDMVQVRNYPTNAGSWQMIL